MKTHRGKTESDCFIKFSVDGLIKQGSSEPIMKEKKLSRRGFLFSEKRFLSTACEEIKRLTINLIENLFISMIISLKQYKDEVVFGTYFHLRFFLLIYGL